MRYVRTYEGFFDKDHAVVAIGKKFGEAEVMSMYEKEKKEWSDDYEGNGNGEAEEHVLASLVSWYEKNHSNLDEDQAKELEDALKSHYKFLA